MLLGLSLVVISGLILVAGDFIDVWERCQDMAVTLSSNATTMATFKENVKVEFNIGKIGGNIQD
ncbi:hypothetical protein [Flavobacterium taihuense]|uniref:Uncharacterized protein n=1 Tax=Flavobacterium taihuense TaxID=2857508 RepID=A0ABS6XY25_9FLAO|nr:hypothetical protein [Flavobacterium taihuense]MBW4361562.1 hypothetical protein [Flavobacterium taihuense]